MLTFNEKLKEIKIWEVVLVSIFSLLFLPVLGIPEELSLGFVIIYILIRARHYFKSMGHDLTHAYSKIPFKTVFLIFVTNLILAFGLGFLTDYLLGIYPWLEYMPGGGEDLLPGLTVAYLLSFIDTVIIAPVSEELIFRGIILSRLNKRLPLVISIIISSVIFGLLHGFSGFISAFIFGVCMCFIYLKTENIFASMTVHILNNLAVMLLIFIPNIEQIMESSMFTLIVSILSLISFIWIVNFLKTTWGEIK